jgi:uncharacterized SAM-binding protein YcdF (DUF218 family)
MKKLSKEFLKAVGEYMLVETPLAKADLCLLFGGERADELATRAAELYHQGYFPLIVVSGGVKTSKGELEAFQMYDVLVKNGVPTSAILIEDKATNTGENVTCTMDLLKKEGKFEDIKSVIGIGQIHGSRRFLMTLERRWPKVLKMFTAPNYFPVSREDWMEDKTFRKAVIREYKKIAPYKVRGLIREVDLEKLEKQIAKQPKPEPKFKPPKFGT